jgi:hypothetical protein
MQLEKWQDMQQERRYHQLLKNKLNISILLHPVTQNILSTEQNSPHILTGSIRQKTNAHPLIFTSLLSLVHCNNRRLSDISCNNIANDHLKIEDAYAAV